MYLNKNQELQINEGIRELKKLATLETCSLDNDTKEKMKLWVTWIDVYAQEIKDALENKIWKQEY
jgi:hypothetical protein